MPRRRLTVEKTMSLQPLDALWTEQPLQTLRKKLLRQQLLLKRSVKRSTRRTVASLRRQYYLTDAFGDSRRAFAQNEDIALAALIIISFLSFSAVSTFANAVYILILAGSVISDVTGINLAVLVIIALGISGVAIAWISAFLQNLLSVALMEGATRKRNRSLRQSLRKALRYASRTAAAWIALLGAAFIPAAVILPVTFLILHFAHIKIAAGLPYLLGAGFLGLAWAVWVLANFSLLPYTHLFDTPKSWRDAATRSQRLVQNKGRLFVLGGHLVFLAALAALYCVALGIQKLTHFNSSIMFLMLNTITMTVANAILTMFYRKRKLARK